MSLDKLRQTAVETSTAGPPTDGKHPPLRTPRSTSTPTTKDTGSTSHRILPVAARLPRPAGSRASLAEAEARAGRADIREAAAAALRLILAMTAGTTDRADTTATSDTEATADTGATTDGVVPPVDTEAIVDTEATVEDTADIPRPPAALLRTVVSLASPVAAEVRVARAATLAAAAAAALRLVMSMYMDMDMDMDIMDMDILDMDMGIARARRMVTTTGWEEIRDPPCGRHPAAALHHQVAVESQASLAEGSPERAARELRSSLLEEHLFV